MHLKLMVINLKTQFIFVTSFSIPTFSIYRYIPNVIITQTSAWTCAQSARPTDSRGVFLNCCSTRET